jgi:hypothetical protein
MKSILSYFFGAITWSLNLYYFGGWLFTWVVMKQSYLPNPFLGLVAMVLVLLNGGTVVYFFFQTTLNRLQKTIALIHLALMLLLIWEIV